MQRFFNEARAANAIRHPGIVEVFDFGTLPSGSAVHRHGALEGESLAARLRAPGPLPPADARRHRRPDRRRARAAHATGIVHRDLKPDNLFLVPDAGDAARELVKVLDFGIAKLGSGAASSVGADARPASLMGTPAYMSPEQCRGTQQIDHRTDIYALGVILYEMRVRPPAVRVGGLRRDGAPPHQPPPPPPRTINPSIPEDLERPILWCLAKEPDERTQTMADVHAALTGRPTPAARPTAKPPGRKRPRRAPTPTTFTQAGAGAIATDVMGRSRGRRTSAVVLGGCSRSAAARSWLTRGLWDVAARGDGHRRAGAARPPDRAGGAAPPRRSRPRRR